jgi:ketosteroid isomerase-like protein
MSDSSVEVANLIGRYAECIDQGDFDGMADLLAEATVADEHGKSPLRGRDAIRNLFASTARLYPDGTPHTKHVTTNLILDVDESAGQARARSYWTVFQAVEGLPLQPILAGRYLDTFERHDGRWRFAERRFAIDLVGDVGHHMLNAPPLT